MIEVDEDTAKVMLKYIYGGIELVEPKNIQEALLSKLQDYGGNGLYIFTIILGHSTVSNGKIEI